MSVPPHSTTHAYCQLLSAPINRTPCILPHPRIPSKSGAAGCRLQVAAYGEGWNGMRMNDKLVHRGPAVGVFAIGEAKTPTLLTWCALRYYIFLLGLTVSWMWWNGNRLHVNQSQRLNRKPQFHVTMTRKNSGRFFSHGWRMESKCQSII